MDLKKYIDTVGGPIDKALVKVGAKIAFYAHYTRYSANKKT